MSSPVMMGPSVKTVTIGVDSQGNPTASPTDVTIWSTLGEQVKWMSSGIAFVVSFDSGSPFAQSTFNGPTVVSGSIQPGATGPYKYCVTVNGHTLDPRTIIKP